MLQTVSIQNFKSLRDVTVNLQKVNLLIGPNNSGKSNFLKALAFIKEHLNGRVQPAILDLNRIYFNQAMSDGYARNNPIVFQFEWTPPDSVKDSAVYRLEILGYRNKKNSGVSSNELIGIPQKELAGDLKLKQIERWISYLSKGYAIFQNNSSFLTGKLENPVLQGMAELDEPPAETFFYFIKDKITLKNESVAYGGFLKRIGSNETILSFSGSDFFNSLKIYKPDPAKISKENMLLFDSRQVNEDCSNLVAFLDTIRDQHDDIWQAIRKDLNKCIPEFIRINLSKIQLSANNTVEGRLDTIGKRFGLEDKSGKTYWAEELSEGTIYFLALLAIIHQPNPPKLLLLEEPEKGIHPRRISEVMNLIFRLAEEKDIQIIITSHSTQVVDEFEDIPESVFVFELQDGETKIKNLLTDIVEPDNKTAKAKKYPKLDFSKHSLGEHWAIGFLGGVPAK